MSRRLKIARQRRLAEIEQGDSKFALAHDPERKPYGKFCAMIDPRTDRDEAPKAPKAPKAPRRRKKKKKASA